MGMVEDVCKHNLSISNVESGRELHNEIRHGCLSITYVDILAVSIFRRSQVASRQNARSLNPDRAFS